MKQGSTLTELAVEVLRQKKAKTDYIADTKALEMIGDFGQPQLNVGSEGCFDIRDMAHTQIAEKVGIPVKYYSRMKDDAPELLSVNVNHWFRSNPEKRMVRTLDGKVRAFLSNRYRPMDNYDLAESVLPKLVASGANVHSCELTENRMYIKAVIDDVRQTVPAPDGRNGTGYSADVVVSPGIVISNSETGHGALAIQPAVHFLSCLNMAVWAEHSLKKYHIGRNFGSGSGGGSGDGVWQFFTDETRKLTDAALWSQVIDLVRVSLEGDVFEQIVTDLHKARADVISADKVTKTVERLSNNQSLSKTESGGVLAYLIDGGDLSRFGLSNAVTRLSQDVDDYDRASFLERIGGEVITLRDTDWSQMVN